MILTCSCGFEHFMVTGRIMSMKNSNDTTGNQSCGLPVCSTVPQSLHHCVPHMKQTAMLNVYSLVIRILQ
jgi:hypothetical protein